MKENVFTETKKLFMDALCQCGIYPSDISINFDGDLIDEECFYSFLLSVQIEPYGTDEGLCTPKPIVFQVDKVEDQEPHIIVGEDTEEAITYGNIFAYMYFYSLEPNSGETARN